MCAEAGTRWGRWGGLPAWPELREQAAALCSGPQRAPAGPLYRSAPEPFYTAALWRSALFSLDTPRHTTCFTVSNTPGWENTPSPHRKSLQTYCWISREKSPQLATAIIAELCLFARAWTQPLEWTLLYRLTPPPTKAYKIKVCCCIIFCASRDAVNYNIPKCKV